jgi:multicomponent Na+:H+ antiporter subunit A
VLFVLVLRRLPDGFERARDMGSRAIRVIVAVTVGAAVFAFAIFSASERSARPVADEMIARSLPDGHGRNVVNVILVDFRGMDTMGEITVLAAAAIGAVALARAGRGRGPRVAPGRAAPLPVAPVERLVFVDVAVRLIFHTVLLASLWLLFAGHNRPGGGFAGGLLAGAAVSLRYVAGGIDEVRAHVRFRPWTILGTGLLLSGSAAIAPLLFGRDVLQAGLWHVEPPLLGEVSLTTALVFDLGVYLLVLGLVLMVFEAFGDDPREAVA